MKGHQEATNRRANKYIANIHYITSQNRFLASAPILPYQCNLRTFTVKVITTNNAAPIMTPNVTLPATSITTWGRILSLHTSFYVTSRVHTGQVELTMYYLVIPFMRKIR